MGGVLLRSLLYCHNKINDFIGPEMKPGPGFFHHENFSTMRTEGLEVEMQYDFGRGTNLAANYTYITYKKRILWMVPRHLGNIIANIRLSRYLNVYAACPFEDGWRRQRGDNRKDMSGYAIVNATLIAKKFLKAYEGLEMRGSVYNLFDKDYTSPVGVSQLPDDTPMPGRSFMVEVKYKF